MILNDNGREYDTDKLESYSVYTQRTIRRLIYLRYVGIRDLLSDCCCQKVKLVAVRKAIQEVKAGISDENIFF